MPFGYREPTTSPTPNYDHPAAFVGYPELVAARLGLTVVNAACPGETTVSFLDAKAKSNGCENLPTSRLGYRSLYPLHVSYRGSQLNFATGYLTAHPDTRLVSLMLGANDGFRCESTTKDHCLSEIQSVTRRVTGNLRRIVTALRATGYGGRLVLVDYYSTNYSDPLATGASEAVNTAVNAAATGQDVSIADGYAAFQPRAAAAGGDSCKAGLLTRLSTGGCGVHPSAAGQALLAAAVEKAAAG